MNYLVVLALFAFSSQSLAKEGAPATPIETALKPVTAPVSTPLTNNDIGQAVMSAILGIRDNLIKNCKIDESLPECMGKVVVGKLTQLAHKLYDDTLQDKLTYLHKNFRKFEMFIAIARKKLFDDHITSVQLIDYISDNFVIKFVDKLLRRLYDSIKASPMGQTFYSMWLILKSFSPPSVKY